MWNDNGSLLQEPIHEDMKQTKKFVLVLGLQKKTCND